MRKVSSIGSERHSFSITNFVLGAAMVGFAVFTRYSPGRSAVADWPWLAGFFMVALGISLVFGAVRPDSDERSPAVSERSAPANPGMPEVADEFQSHDPTEPTKTPE
jgi:hypothetical protein